MTGTLTAAHVNLLGGVDLFSRLDRVALARLAACVELVGYQAGEAVCRQGDPSDGLYVGARGTFAAFLTANLPDPAAPGPSDGAAAATTSVERQAALRDG